MSLLGLEKLSFFLDLNIAEQETCFILPGSRSLLLNTESVLVGVDSFSCLEILDILNTAAELVRGRLGLLFALWVGTE